MARCGEAAGARRAYGRAMNAQARRKPALLQAAALARMEEMMNRHSVADSDAKAQARAMWGLGDYHRFATQTVWSLGPVLVEACRISPGDRVLDVAAGSGNVAIRAAEAGATVVASDLTPENLEAGRREADAHGVELEWAEADAEALPFDDGEFDVVTSSLGAIFAPDHQAVADEMLRVCRKGGKIGMINFTPEGLAGEFFGLFADYAPPPPAGAQPPVLWGAEDHVRELFGNGVDELELSRRHYVERSPGGPGAYRDFFKETFGPMIGLYASLEDQPDRAKALDRDFLDFATRANQGPPGGAAEYSYEYLLVVGRRASLAAPADES
jgi:ubiquinone/menaquinone biosynthesis C-methylase UbiE